MLKMDATRTAARRRRARGALLGVGLALGLAAPASAQWFGGFAERPLPPQDVTRMLAARGFTDLSWPRFDGEVYTVEGTNRFGDRVRLTIDAYDGDIVGRRRLARAGDPFGYAPIPPRDIGRSPIGREGPVAALDPPETPRAPDPQPTPRSELPARKPAGTPLAARPADTKPAQPMPPSAPARVAAAPKPQAPAASKSAPTVAARSATPVRIIGGVTPLNPNQPGTAQQASAEPETPPL